MNKGLKIVLGLVVFLVVVLSGALYFITTKINPEEIRKLVISSVSKALPGSSVALEKVEYGLGTSIKFKLQNLDLKLKDGKTKLFNVKDIDVNIPIYAILTGGGTIDLTINNPQAYFREINPGINNWSKALPKAIENTQEKKAETNTESKKLELPNFVDHSKVNIKINNIDLFYSPYLKKESKIIISKVNLKNLNLKSSNAFEIVSHVNYALDDEKTISTNLQVIGEVDLGTFLKEKKLNTTLVVDIKETKISGLDLKIPDIENKVKLTILEDGRIDTSLKIKASNAMEANTNVVLNKNSLNISNLNLNLNFNSLKNFLDQKTISSLKILDYSNSTFNLTGETIIQLDQIKIKPNLNFELKGPLGINAIDEIPITTTFKGSFIGDDVRVKLVNELLSGMVSTEIKTKLDVLKIPNSIEKLNPISLDLLATNLKLSRNFIQKNLYNNKPQNNEKTNVVNAENSLAQKILLPKVDVNLEGKNIFVDNQELAISTVINIDKDKISSKKIELKYAKGKVTTPLEIYLKDSKNIQSKINLIMQDIEFSSFSPFLPPVVSKVSGNFNGQIEGMANLLASGLTYNFNINVSAINGEIKDFKLKELLTKMFDGIKDKFPKKAEFVTNRFENLALTATVDEKLNQIKKFEIIGDNRSFELKLNGKLFMINKESVLIGSFKDSNTANDLKNNTGMDYYPLKLSGQGFVLINPHPEYTLQILGGAMAKKQAQNVIKKESKNLEKKAKKEINKLLKGIKF